MLSFYSVPASKPWGHPENTKGTMGKHQKFRALQPYIPTGQGRPLKPSALRVENFSTWPECYESHAIAAHIVFICSHFRTQGEFTTDCDGSVRHKKWQEPAGTLSMALTAYNNPVHPRRSMWNFWHTSCPHKMPGVHAKQKHLSGFLDSTSLVFQENQRQTDRGTLVRSPIFANFDTQNTSACFLVTYYQSSFCL